MRKGSTVPKHIREKISKSMIGVKHSSERKKKIGLSNTGKIFTDERKLKISNALKERYKDKTKHPCYGKKRTFSEETKIKMSIAAKKRCTPEWKKWQSELRKKQFAEGIIKPYSHWKGKKLPKEHKQKISKGLKGKPKTEEHNRKVGLAHTGEKSRFWKGGITTKKYPEEFYKIRKHIRRRDKYICQMCNIKENGRHHDVHHINYKKNDSRPENLITLCSSCHTYTNQNRTLWHKFFLFNEHLNFYIS